MERTSYERPLPSIASTVSPLTVALFAAAGIMLVTGVLTAVTTVPSIVTSAYYVSTFVLIVLLWVHGLQTVRQQS